MLRERMLADAERGAIERELKQGDPDRLIDTYIDKWIDPSTVLRAAESIRLNPLPQFRVLRQFTADNKTIFYLPAIDKEPCEASSAVKVAVWWSKDKIHACPRTAASEQLFDGKIACHTAEFFAAGQCGCSYLFVSCLPEERRAAAAKEMREEFTKTADRLILDEKRPLPALYTTTGSWESGVVRLIYARREMLQIAKAQGVTAKVKTRMRKLLKRADVLGPSRWVERGPLYEGSGLLVNGAGTMNGSYRDIVRQVFSGLTCTPFESIEVDRDVVIKSVNGDPKLVANLRELDPDPELDTPMKHQEGCKSCHVPLDVSGWFFKEMELTPDGAFHRAKVPLTSQLYLTGENDFRGEGKGIAGAMSLLVRQPEFADCVVERVFKHMAHRKPLISERASLGQLAREFEKRDHDFLWIARSVARFVARKE